MLLTPMEAEFGMNFHRLPPPWIIFTLGNLVASSLSSDYQLVCNCARGFIGGWVWHERAWPANSLDYFYSSK